MIKVEVNGKPVEIPAGATVMAACEEAGLTIPRFCYHDRLSIAGNCRMCLVEVEKSPKPVASCAMPAMPGMKIKTETQLVKKAREGVMEFLLANHPLDCPICDQGGECDLQDQSMYFGGDRSRFREWKRSVEDKNLGPLVKTVMTRCIHCTRCVRFAAEIAGVPLLGTTGRGSATEIGTYVEKVFDSEVSGNVIDLCPVGALTSKPYAFRARPWELKHTESVDVLESTCASIRVDTRGPEILRILPRLNEEVNEEWIGDKSRYAFDGLKRQRLDTPLLKKDGEFVPVDWAEALLAIQNAAKGVRGKDMLAVTGDLADAESTIALKDLFNRLGSANLAHTQELSQSADSRAGYLFNSTLAGIEEADLVLLVDSNPRMEAPLVATRLRKMVRANLLKVWSVGPEADLAFPHTHLGSSTTVLKQLAEGKHAMSAAFAKAKRPIVIVGAGAQDAQVSGTVQQSLAQLKKLAPNLVANGWNGVSYLHTTVGRVIANDLGFVAGPNASVNPAKAKFVYLLNADSAALSFAPDAFVVYQGHNGDVGANQASVILPGVAYTEKSATYVSTEGRVVRTRPATGPINKAREDWTIVRAVSEAVGAPLPYDSLAAVRERLHDVAPHFAHVDSVQAATVVEAPQPAAAAAPADAEFQPAVVNYWMTDAISRNSKTMAKCASTLPVARNSYKKQQQQATRQ